MTALLAFNLNSVRSARVGDGISAAPFYRRFSAAGQHVIRSIHAIPQLYEDTVLGDIEVYLGRAGGTREHVLGRYRETSTRGRTTSAWSCSRVPRTTWSRGKERATG